MSLTFKSDSILGLPSVLAVIYCHIAYTLTYPLPLPCIAHSLGITVTAKSQLTCSKPRGRWTKVLHRRPASAPGGGGSVHVNGTLVEAKCGNGFEHLVRVVLAPLEVVLDVLQTLLDGLVGVR